MLILTSNHNKVQIYATINVQLSVDKEVEGELDSLGPRRMNDPNGVSFLEASRYATLR